MEFGKPAAELNESDCSNLQLMDVIIRKALRQSINESAQCTQQSRVQHNSEAAVMYAAQRSLSNSGSARRKALSTARISQHVLSDANSEIGGLRTPRKLLEDLASEGSERQSFRVKEVKALCGELNSSRIVSDRTHRPRIMQIAASGIFHEGEGLFNGVNSKLNSATNPTNSAGRANRSLLLTEKIKSSRTLMPTKIISCPSPPPETTSLKYDVPHSQQLENRSMHSHKSCCGSSIDMPPHPNTLPLSDSAAVSSHSILNDSFSFASLKTDSRSSANANLNGHCCSEAAQKPFSPGRNLETSSHISRRVIDGFNMVGDTRVNVSRDSSTSSCSSRVSKLSGRDLKQIANLKRAEEDKQTLNGRCSARTNCRIMKTKQDPEKEQLRPTRNLVPVTFEGAV